MTMMSKYMEDSDGQLDISNSRLLDFESHGSSGEFGSHPF